MAQKYDPDEVVTFKELLMANSIEIQAIATLLIEKGIISRDEYFTQLKRVQAEYQSKKKN